MVTIMLEAFACGNGALCRPCMFRRAASTLVRLGACIFHTGAPMSWHDRPLPCPVQPDAHVLAAGLQTLTRSRSRILRASRAERWSFARLDAAVRGTGTGLAALGLPPGARVFCAWAIAWVFRWPFLGVAVGLVPVPTSTALTGPEISAMVQGVEPRAGYRGRRRRPARPPGPVLTLEAVARHARSAAMCL